VSPAVTAMPEHGTRAIAAIAARHPDVIDLTLGEPDFATPAHIAEAGVSAVRAGRTRYAPGAGLPALRKAAAEAVTARTGASVAGERVVVTAGAVLGVFAALAALVPRGGRVLVPDPGWSCYVGQCTLLGFEPVRYQLDSTNGFEPDLEALDALAAASDAALLVINNPGNPTGAVWRRQTVERCVELARRHGMWLLADEVYDELTFDREHVSTVPLGDDGGVVTTFSFSKTYAMTGWRVGYLVASPEIAAATTRVLEHAASSVAMPSQYAALAALQGPQDCVAHMRSAYRERRDLALERLDLEGLSCSRPDGAFYALVDVSAADADSASFARSLASRTNGVACAPGDAFGPAAAGMLRLSLAAAPTAIDEGIRRIGRAVRGEDANGLA
jgi:aspartate/methionine/tyrosine aminotransferase